MKIINSREWERVSLREIEEIVVIYNLIDNLDSF
jgi:hypothetical protein